jgi:putative transcriptional regulator
MKTRIKELRARYNLTQESLSKKVNVRRETIVFLEQGKYNPSLQLAYDISKVFFYSIILRNKRSTKQKINAICHRHPPKVSFGPSGKTGVHSTQSQTVRQAVHSAP